MTMSSWLTRALSAIFMEGHWVSWKNRWTLSGVVALAWAEDTFSSCSVCAGMQPLSCLCVRVWVSGCGWAHAGAGWDGSHWVHTTAGTNTYCSLLKLGYLLCWGHVGRLPPSAVSTDSMRLPPCL